MIIFFANRLVERHNLKKQKEKELTEKEVTCSKKPDTKTVTLNVPKGVKVLINQIDEHIEDHPSTSGSPSSQHEVMEEQPNKVASSSSTINNLIKVYRSLINYKSELLFLDQRRKMWNLDRNS